jgi:crotonobetainyl-CoA:carnitine CoA-transferase CaiB-like acyl-CoA transferase
VTTEPLDGVRVLEFAQLFPGPYAALVLQSLGANVIKVEPPTGDPTRSVPPFVNNAGGAGAVFCALNQHKRSVQLDLTTDDDREAFHALADASDVVIDGYRPGVSEKLGVDYDTLAADREHLVHVHLTGFGTTGPHAGEGGHDVTYQAWAGAIHPDDARLPNLPTADSTSALWAALLATAHLGNGCVHLAPSLTGSLAAPQILDDAIAAAGHDANPLTGDLPGYEVYECADAPIAIGALEPKFWTSLCQALDAQDVEPLGHPADPQDPEIARQRLSEILAAEPVAHWVNLLGQHDVPCAPVRSTREAMRDSVGTTSVDPPGVDGPEDLQKAPRLGEHNREVLASLGN